MRRPRGIRRTIGRLVLLLLTAAACPVFSSVPGKPFDWGFIASRHPDVLGHTRTKAVGPLFERVEAPGDVRYTGFRPFTSGIRDPGGNRSLRDVVWPVYNQREIGDELSWRALFFFGFGHDAPGEVRRHREWFIPFYFQGRNASGDSYRALFPLGGRIEEILGRDEVSFVLFPLHLRTRINDIHSTSWLWPVFSKTEGPGVHRWRVFPFYGYADHEGKYTKRFVLWPIWNDVTYRYPKSHGNGFVLFPLFGRLNLSDQQTTWVIPPLFRFTRGEMQDIVYCPWPFVQWGRGRGDQGEKDFFYLWPVYGQKTIGNLERQFLAWPFLWHSKVTYPDSVQHRYMAIPFYIHKHRYRDTGEGRETMARYVKVWPLFMYHRQGDVSKFRVIDLLPFGEIQGVERNLAPLWSLVTRHARGDDVDWEVLWGLYRDHKRGDEARYRSLFPVFEHWRDERVQPPYRAWSLFKGLLKHESRGEASRWRFLYFFSSGARIERPDL